ncbi:ras-like protein family member 11A-like isoform X2 [Gambusia affinis]|uniref:ras-like protein family member 11A-like isoform X2 n=1 Tax=Gambusia affinis TaxID=33528 RepID=UPI001CDD35A9|nr:ras-like protein family member 11A-like isoform X2 [Gambusia affinis]
MKQTQVRVFFFPLHSSDCLCLQRAPATTDPLIPSHSPFHPDLFVSAGALYSRKVTMDGEEVSLQIQDTPCVALQDDAEGLYCQEQINRSIYWADGYVLVFSITDNSSYRTIQPLYQHIRRIHPSGNIPVILVGNKSDLLRARQVPAEEGDTLATSLGGVYFEASARENHEGVHAAFLHLCQEVIRALGGGNGEKRKGGLHLARPKSPNMQELKRRFRQVLSSKVKSATTI